MTIAEYPKWVDKEIVLAIHNILIAEHSGLSGIRDEGLLDFALDRPKNIYLYNEDSSLFELAAALGFSLIKNHPFIDGNKRVSLTVTGVFLDINGWSLNAPEPETVIIFSDLASGSLKEKDFAVCLEKNCSKNN